MKNKLIQELWTREYYGCWIAEDGKVFPVKDLYGHDRVMMDLIAMGITGEVPYFNEDMLKLWKDGKISENGYRDIYCFAFMNGFSRFAFQKGEILINGQLKNIQDTYPKWIGDLRKHDLEVYIDIERIESNIEGYYMRKRYKSKRFNKPQAEFSETILDIKQFLGIKE